MLGYCDDCTTYAQNNIYNTNNDETIAIWSSKDDWNQFLHFMCNRCHLTDQIFKKGLKRQHRMPISRLSLDRSPKGVTIPLNFNGEYYNSRSKWLRNQCKSHSQSAKTLPKIISTTSIEVLSDSFAKGNDYPPIQSPDSLPSSSFSDLPLTDPSDLFPELEQLSRPIFDLDVEELSTQDRTNIEDSEKNPVLESHSMDWEGFQDLKRWCDTPRVEAVPIPTIDESFESIYCNELLDSCKMKDEISWDSYPRSNSLNPTMSDISKMPIVNTNTVPLPINSDVQAQNEFIMSIDENFMNYDNVLIMDPEPVHNWDDLGICVEDDIYIDNEHYYEDNQNTCYNSDNGNGKVYNEYSIDNPEFENVIEQSDIEIDPCSVESDQIFNSSDHELKSHTFTTDVPLLSNTKLRNDILINSVIINDNCENEVKTHSLLNVGNNINNKPIKSLKLNFDKVIHAPLTANDCPVTTPDVLKTVEQLEKDSFSRTSYYRYADNLLLETPQNSHFEASLVLTPPDTPKFQSHKRKNSCADSDDSSSTYSPRKSVKRRRKSNVSSALLKASATLAHQNNPVKIGRPRKSSYLNSPASSVHTDISSINSPENIHRVKRERNNEASRRSRFNRKVKEIVMLETAEELMKKNDELRIKIKMLEVKTKRMKYLVFKPFLPK